MNLTEYTSLINKPDAITDVQSINMEKIVLEFPYFQSARAIYLKGLYNQNSFKYNYALKITAAHTTDRSVLFDFITSDDFTSIKNVIFDEKINESPEIIIEKEKKLEEKINTVEESIQTSIEQASILENENKENKISFIEELTIATTKKSVENLEIDKLEIGKPLSFSNTEKHSFQEWLQLSKIKPIIREEKIIMSETASEVKFEKQKKNDLIDKFIKTSPKIPTIKKDAQTVNVFYEPSISNTSYLMTETLARVYLEQKKYQKAIQAYEILILKYPEKSSFFADRILDIKNLQQNNN